MAKTVNNVKVNATFTTATAREQLTSGENLCTSLGKVNKYLVDLDAGAFTFPANGGNADTLAENSIDKFLKYNGLATDCNECTTRGVYQVDNSTLNIPDAVISPLYTPILFVVDETCQLFFTGTEVYNRLGTLLNGGSYPAWNSWTNVASGGDASTVGGKSLSDLMVWGMSYDERTKITSGDLNDYTTVGSYVVTTADVAATLTNSPWTKTGYFLDVYYRTSGYCTQVAMTWDGFIKIRALSGGTWYSWRDIVHSNYVASSTSPGIVTTETQHFKGQKFFDNNVYIPNPSVVMGNGAPSADTSRGIVITSSDNSSTNYLANFTNVARANGNNELYLQLRSFTSKTLLNCLISKINADGTNSYTMVTNPIEPAKSALRNLSSGSATPQTKDPSAAGYVSSGSWYGKHD